MQALNQASNGLCIRCFKTATPTESDTRHVQRLLKSQAEVFYVMISITNNMSHKIFLES